jgi:hypothetical protein
VALVPSVTVPVPSVTVPVPFVTVLVPLLLQPQAVVSSVVFLLRKDKKRLVSLTEFLLEQSLQMQSLQMSLQIQ